MRIGEAKGSTPYSVHFKTISLKKLLKQIVLPFETLYHIFTICVAKGLRRFKPLYAYGGMRLCWQMVCFQVVKLYHNRIRTPYEPSKNQLTSRQSQFLLCKCKNQPLISIITPVYKVDSKWLDLCIRSVVNQYYPNWELILVDDGSDRPELTELIHSWCQMDDRIKSVLLDQNRGIAGATNTGFDKAVGEFIGILDHDDELTPDALVWVVWYMNKYPKAKWFYSDEDLITIRSDCHSPFFKPDYSPENLLSRNYICHFRIYAADILKQIGGIRSGYDGAQDHDLALRYVEQIQSDQIVHIPRVLYHWRTISTSAATTIQAKPQAAVAGVNAVSEALQRRGIGADVTSHPLSPTLYQIKLKSRIQSKVTIIISSITCNHLLSRCLESVRQNTSYPNLEIFILDDTAQEVDQEDNNRCVPVRIVKCEVGSGYSKRLNIAAKASDAEYLVFMDKSVEVIDPNWLDQLVATIQMDSTIGAAGGMLISPNGNISTAGIVLGVKNGIGQAFRKMNAQLVGDACRVYAMQEYSSLCGHMLAVRRQAFVNIEGFDSHRYPNACHDIDLCLRLQKEDVRCVYNPMIKAVCHAPLEMKDMDSLRNLQQDYPEMFMNDPFYNPNLSLDNECFLGYRNFPLEKQIPELLT